MKTANPRTNFWFLERVFSKIFALLCATASRGWSVFLLSIFRLKPSSVVASPWEIMLKLMASARTWLPRLAKIDVAVNQLILQYLNQTNERE